MRYLTSRVTGIPLSLSGIPSKRKENATLNCLHCGATVAFRMKKKLGSIKPVECKNCSTKFIARAEQDGKFSLELRKPSPVIVSCPSCTTSFEMAIDPMPGSVLTYSCPKCKKEMRVLRTTTGVRAKIISTKIDTSPPPKKTELGEEVIELIRGNLLPQPWPKGIHKTVAARLNLPDQLVQLAIQTLIKRGIFNPQIDGKLYVPAPIPKESG